MKSHRIEIYKDKKSEYRWRLISRNGQTVGDGSEGYTRRDNLMRALKALHEAFTQAVEIVDIDA